MNDTKKAICLEYSKYGNGKAIIEILNIGYEPLLTIKEYKIYKEIEDLKNRINSLKKAVLFIKTKLFLLDESECYYKWLYSIKIEHEKKVNLYEEKKKHKSNLFRTILAKNKNIRRKIFDDREFKNEDQFRNITIFESDLTRCFGCQDMKHSDDIISVVTYYTEIFKSIIHNGFDYKGKHYVFFTAGAGQTRCKKSTFVLEDQLNKNYNKLFCGLSHKIINDQGGINPNKYLAYTSLCQTNSEIWFDFNIDKAIIVDDIEYELLDQQVRYIYTESPEDKELLNALQLKVQKIVNELKDINKRKKESLKGHRRTKDEIQYEKKLKQNKKELLNEINLLKLKYHKTENTNMPITIPFTDGFGISLKKMSTSMIRLPFIKGLIAYCPRRAFQNWCSENNYEIHKITDIYGKNYSFSEIDIIFTKSQFKMWKYYNNILDKDGNILKSGWEVYKENYKKFKCDACVCNVETNVKLNAKTNYQMLQTLTTEMTDTDILKLAEYDINSLNGIGKNTQSMLNILGANEKKNDKMNWLQKSLLIYPEMLKEYYVKTLLKNTKDSMMNKIKSGKFNINGAYTYVIPDTLACLQWWFTDMNKTKIEKFGFVKKNLITCRLFDNKEEIDCVRSPHLDHAHCIRKNYINDNIRKWVKSDGVYVGMTDNMSKLLMYDNDGDKILLHNNKTIIKCAKTFQKKYNMIPNHYDMPKANPEILSTDSIFNGIVMAYHHGNIGTPSNEITKVWVTLNQESAKAEIKKAIDVIALRCVDVNFTIDFAKTLYKPIIPKHILNNYKAFSGKKAPYFFIYAKGKTKYQVESRGKCNIDRISDIVKSNRITFRNLLGKYTYKKLMSNPDVDITTDKAKTILELYRKIENVNLRKLSHVDFSTLDFDEKKYVKLQLEFNSIKQRKMFIEIVGESKKYITDILIKSLINDINKDTLWRLFGDVIHNNIKNNLKNTKICKNCSKRFSYNIKSYKPVLYCDKCGIEVKKQKDKNRMKNIRKLV